MVKIISKWKNKKKSEFMVIIIVGDIVTLEVDNTLYIYSENIGFDN